MGATAEADACRLAKEGRTGRGEKSSSQKSPWRAVVGSRSGVFIPMSAHSIQSYCDLFAARDHFELLGDNTNSPPSKEEQFNLNIFILSTVGSGLIFIPALEMVSNGLLKFLDILQQLLPSGNLSGTWDDLVSYSFDRHL